MIAEIAGGAVVGVAVGFGSRCLLPRLALPSVGLYPIAVLALMALAYGIASVPTPPGSWRSMSPPC